MTTVADDTRAAAGRDRVVVVGAGMAGLLAARVLADHYPTVLVLDRDELPREPVDRPGVPQGRHSHGLLARGRDVLETLFPGLTDDLVRRGALLADVQATTRVYIGDRPLAAAAGDLRSLRVSRRLLEWYVRQRVAALPGVEIRDRTSVVDLVVDPAGGAVTGVVASPVDGDGRLEMGADVVVDASGRTTRVPVWLSRHGVTTPPEERVRVDVSYATRRFRRPPGHPDGGARTVLCPPTPRTPRAAVAIPQELGGLTVSVAGYHGDRPPTDLDGFAEFARTCCSPAIADLVTGLEPVDDGATYRFAANRRARFERAAAHPAGLVVLGDALCAFDPVFGQGMTVAALECLELGRCLSESRDDLARRFFPRAAVHLDTPWTLVVGSIRRQPDPDAVTPDGPRRRRLPERRQAVDRYVRALQRAATDDAVLADAFLRVVHLVEPSPSLLRPRYAARVAKARLAPTRAGPLGRVLGRRARPTSPTPAGAEPLDPAAPPGPTPPTLLPGTPDTSHTDAVGQHHPSITARQEATPS